MRFIIIIFIIFIFTCQSNSTENLNEISILCYHNISPKMHNDINTSPEEFERHIKYLNKNGYTTILSKDIRSSTIRTKKPIIITFDDGKESIYKYAFPIMKKYNFKGIIFIIIRDIGKYGFMTENEISELIKNGWEIGSHTMNHPDLNHASKRYIEYEFKKSKEILEQKFNTKIISIAYPYGIINQRILKISKENYEYGYTIIEGNDNLSDLHSINRHMILNSMTIKDLEKIIRGIKNEKN